MEENQSKDFSQIPAELQKKMKKYFKHLSTKFPDRTIPELREKVAKRFNIKFVE